ncbi:hypothetical protein PIB30_059499 [Stylosanthes scabra]|uniref:Uncharacterized protein n=1 Tax=Stylosanthes scabra TaxID=79078 RepID=A0ABU6WIL3_9FABA|nr:hypothetical protein [Stylosanthes scabra]
MLRRAMAWSASRMISSGEKMLARRRGTARPLDEHWCITSALQGTAGGGPARPLRRSSQKRRVGRGLPRSVRVRFAYPELVVGQELSG